MNEKIKYLIFFLMFTLSLCCSFDNKTGIWAGSEKEKRRITALEEDQRSILDVVNIYTSENYYSEEISAVKSINLTEPKTNSSWQMSSLNLQNFVGNIHLLACRYRTFVAVLLFLKHFIFVREPQYITRPR